MDCYELLPLEIWVMIFKERSRVMARATLAPAAYVVRRLRGCIEESWQNGSVVYTKCAAIEAQMSVTTQALFGPYLTSLAPAKVLWEQGLDREGLVTIMLRVPDHPFVPVEDEELQYAVGDHYLCRPCNGNPLQPNPECQLCTDLCKFCINLLYAEELLTKRALWVMKKLGCNGIWPGWEDSPDYVRTLALLEKVSDCKREDMMTPEQYEAHFPDLVQPHFVPKSVLSAKWQPIVALSVVLDIVLEAPISTRGAFMSTNPVYEDMPWTTGGDQFTFTADPDGLEERTFGLAIATKASRPFITQFLNSGGNHIPASVRNHRVLSPYGQLRRWYPGITLPQGQHVSNVVAHTWYFAENPVDPQLPACPYSKEIPVFNTYDSNPLLSDTVSESNLSGEALFIAISERCGPVEIVACGGKCRLDNVNKGSVSWQKTEHPHTSRKRGHYAKSKSPQDGVFRSPDGTEDEGLRWCILPDSPDYRCWGRNLAEPMLSVLLQEDLKNIKGKSLAHWCPSWRVSNRLKQILPVVGSTNVRYIEGQLPLAMALFSTCAWEKVSSLEGELAVRFAGHAMTFQTATSITGPQLLAHQLGLQTKRLCVLWDRMRSLVQARSVIYHHIQQTGDLSHMIWNEDGQCPFILEAKRSQWRYDYSLTCDLLAEPVLKRNVN